MIEKTFVLYTEEQARKLAKIFNASNYVWGACVPWDDKRRVVVSFYNEAGVKWGKEKFEEVYDND